MLILILPALFLQAEASGPDYKRNLWNLFSFRHSHSPPPSPAHERVSCQGAEELDVFGLMSWLLFSSVVLMVGVWAGWSQRGKEKNPEQILLAGRNLNFCVGVLSSAATWSPFDPTQTGANSVCPVVHALRGCSSGVLPTPRSPFLCLAKSASSELSRGFYDRRISR